MSAPQPQASPGRLRSIALSVALGVGLYLMLLGILVLGQALGASKFIYVDF